VNATDADKTELNSKIYYTLVDINNSFDKDFILIDESGMCIMSVFQLFRLCRDLIQIEPLYWMQWCSSYTH